MVIKKQNEDETPFKTGTSQKTTPSDASSSIYTLLEKLQNVNKQFSKNIFIYSDGNELTNEQQEYFKDSKVRDKDGNLLVVYHGSNVKAYYINITNPADEQTGYKALRKYQGQNEAGIKAREYLESLGYDGVNNGNVEYIAFNSNQIKMIDNAAPTNKSDIRYSRNTSIDDFDVKRYNEVDDNPHIVNAKAEESYRKNYYEIDTSTNGLFDDVKTRRSNSRYSEHGDEFLDGRRTTKPNDGLANRKIRAEDSDNGTGHTENDGDVDLRGEDNRKSRNTRLNHDENFDDVIEQAIKVLQNIKGIDVSSELVEEEMVADNALAVFSAPFSINNEPFYMAAVVNVKTEKNQYYLHEFSVEAKKTHCRSRLGPSMTALPATMYLLSTLYLKNSKMSISNFLKTFLLTAMVTSLQTINRNTSKMLQKN